MRRTFRPGFGRGQVSRAIDEELSFHLDMRTARLIQRGMSASEARREALRQFGDMPGVRDQCISLDIQRERAMYRADLLADFRQDVRYSLRALRRNVGFTTIVVLTLSLGIAANTAIFTLVNALLLRPLPVRAPHELVIVGDPARVNSLSEGSARSDLFSYPQYLELRRRSTTLQSLAATGRSTRLNVRIDGGEPEHPRGRYVSANYFSVLGISAGAGRTFDGTEDSVSANAAVAVISDAYWARRFSRDRAVIGKRFDINHQLVTIIGVAPPGFSGEIVGQPIEIWFPIALQPMLVPHTPMLENRGMAWLVTFGRLQRGTTLDGVQAEFDRLVRQSMTVNPTPFNLRNAQQATILVSEGARGLSRMRKTYAAPLLTLTVGVALLLLIVCANVGTLLFARAVSRTREVAVRLAIGAERGRLLRQLLTESLVLATLSAAVSVVIAAWASRVLLTLASSGSTVPLLDVGVDVRILLFTLALSLLTVGIFGLLPAWGASRVDLASTIRANTTRAVSSGFGRSASRWSPGRLLIAAQVALSLVLLLGASLLVRNLRALESADTGVARDQLLIVGMDAADGRYAGPRLNVLSEQVRTTFAALPGVRSVSYSENGLFSGTESSGFFQAEGFTARESTDTLANYDQVGPGYFAAIGARLVGGRDFTAQDRIGSAPVIIVNQTMAQFLYPRTDAIGKRIRLDDSTNAEIVGVAADIVDHDLQAAPTRRFYVPYLQGLEGQATSLVYELRSDNPSALTAAVRRELNRIDPEIAIRGNDPLRELMRESVSESRLLTQLAAGFGLFALLLAAVGLYGVMSYALARRTAEIGLRSALGADRSRIVRMVMGDAMRLVLLGLVIGVPLALAATRLLRTQLHAVEPTDPAAAITALAILVISAMIAAFIPAMRASRIAPLEALRQE